MESIKLFMVLFVVVLIGAVMVVGIVILFQCFLAPHRPRHHHTTGVREEHPTFGGGCEGGEPAIIDICMYIYIYIEIHPSLRPHMGPPWLLCVMMIFNVFFN